MKTLLLKNWNFMRLLRLAIGVWAVVEAFQNSNSLLGLLGGSILVMAVMNIGCCSVNGSCKTPASTNKKQSEKPGEISDNAIS
ncbi:MAG: hypothetical protein ABIO76_02815 [Ginsengibacter sp.]